MSDYPVFHPYLFGKFRNAHLNTLMLHNSVRAFIALLLCLGCPSTVFLVIPKIVVPSVYGMQVRRAVPHILHECLVTEPSVAKYQISLGVFSCLQSVISGSGFHVAPATISPGAFVSIPVSCVAMFDLGLGNFASSAFTASGIGAYSESIPEHRLNGAAVAATKPHRVPAFSVLGASLDYGPCSEALSGNVFDVGVKDDTLGLGFRHNLVCLSSSAVQSLHTAGRRALFRISAGITQGQF